MNFIYSVITVARCTECLYLHVMAADPMQLFDPFFFAFRSSYENLNHGEKPFEYSKTS